MTLRKALAITFLVVSGGALLLIVTSPVWGGWLLQRSMKETYDEISKVTLTCPPNTSQVIEPWSKGGYSVSCRAGELKDGPWQGWEGGHLAVSGTYVQGKEQGPWVYYARDGKQIVSTVRFENGKELPNAGH